MQMRTVRRLLTLSVGLCLGGLIMAAPASAASAFQTLYNDYRDTGSIAPCKYSAAELQSAQSQIPPDSAQYTPDFGAGIQAALQARARGVCGGAGNTGRASASSSSSGVATRPKNPPRPSPAGVTPAPIPSTPVAAAASPIATAAVAAAAAGGSGTAAVALIALAILMAGVAAAVVWRAVHRAGHAPSMGSAGHAAGEVRLRHRGTVRQFADWIRLRR
jgi:hypothetical protein